MQIENQHRENEAAAVVHDAVQQPAVAVVLDEGRRAVALGQPVGARPAMQGEQARVGAEDPTQPVLAPHHALKIGSSKEPPDTADR